MKTIELYERVALRGLEEVAGAVGAFAGTGGSQKRCFEIVSHNFRAGCAQPQFGRSEFVSLLAGPERVSEFTIFYNVRT